MSTQFNDPMAPLGAAATNAQVNQTSTAPAMAPIVPNPTPQIAPVATGSTSPSFFQEGGGLEVGLGAIQTLGSLWNSFQQQKMAQKTFNLQKSAYDTNLSNQRSTYNSALEDRIRSRYATEGKTTAQANKTIAERSL